MTHRHRQAGVAAIVLALFALGGAVRAQASSVTIQARSTPQYAFAPAAKTIHVGDTVVWTIEPGDPHTITSGTIAGVPDGKFNSGTLFPGPQGHYSHKFTKAGTYPYFCAIHADTGMTGVITVVAATPTPTPRPTPKPTPRPTPRPTAKPTPPPTPKPSAAPTLAPAPSPGLPEVGAASPEASQSAASFASASPISSATSADQSPATGASGGTAPTSGPDSVPLVGGGILVAAAILGAAAVVIRRGGGPGSTRP